MTAKEVLDKWTEAVGDTERGMRYWVIKNPDTGLYFRGKGTNRWGKYFNQASIYRIKGTAEHSALEINQYKRPGEKAVVIEIQITEIEVI
jgi:hypothetical protein